MKSFFIFFAYFIFISCSTIGKNTSKSNFTPSSEYQEAFETHLHQLENGQFQQAAQGFSILAQKIKQGPDKWASLFNAGSAFLKLNQCEKSKNNFYEVLNNTKSHRSFKTHALLQLHYAYDCLGQLQKSLETLHKVAKFSKNLSETSRLVEIPGRLSILYIQFNNTKQALFYQNQALKGIQNIKSTMKDDTLIEREASRLFYIIGRSVANKKMTQIEPFLRALPYHQLYLIQSFLLSNSKWSTKSKEKLIELYDKLWAMYKKIPAKKRNLYKNKIIKSLKSFQKISKESQSDKLSKLSSFIVSKAINQFGL